MSTAMRMPLDLSRVPRVDAVGVEERAAATPGVVLVMLEAIRDFYRETGRRIGMKPAGGVRTSKQALHLLVLVRETLGAGWLTPDLFRIGASTLANDLLMQLVKEATGRHQSGDYFSRD